MGRASPRWAVRRQNIKLTTPPASGWSCTLQVQVRVRRLILYFADCLHAVLRVTTLCGVFYFISVNMPQYGSTEFQITSGGEPSRVGGRTQGSPRLSQMRGIPKMRDNEQHNHRAWKPWCSYQHKDDTETIKEALLLAKQRPPQKTLNSGDRTWQMSVRKPSLLLHSLPLRTPSLQCNSSVPLDPWGGE